MSSLLLHSCCAHCAAYCVEFWRGQGHQVTSLWFNPNIHPYREHQSRLEAMRSLARAMGLPLIISPGYEMVGFLRLVVGREGERCRYCFRLRLSRAVELAREGGFDAFSTTLLISPHQQHDLLRRVGEEMAREHGACFLYHDLRPGYAQSRQLTRGHDLYRQEYCGCIYSEWERFGRLTIPPTSSSC